MAIQSNFPSVRPSLLLDFASTKQLDPRISFSRASTATFYNGVTTAMAEQNLAPKSQELSDTSVWSTQAITVTANTSVAPDGTTTADTITASATAATHFLFFGSYPTVAIGIQLGCSVYAKAGTNNFFQLTVLNQANTYANFDLSTGTIGTTGSNVSSVTMTSVGSGWYRCSFVITSTTDAANSALTFLPVASNSVGRIPTWTPTGTETVILWGAQVEQRSAVTAYTATTTQAITNYIPVLQTAASGVARFDNNPTTGESLGLLIEESRTNLVTYSSQFDNAAWTKAASSITSNTIVAPDGTLIGDLLIPDTSTGGNHATYNSATLTAASHTYSVYAKAFGYNFLVLKTDIAGYVEFNLSTGAVSATSGANYTSTITSVGNGWYRCTITFTGTVASYAMYNYVYNATGAPSYAGNGFSGIFLWGAQVELGAFSTSYVPTVASQVTRAADNASMTGTNFTSWYNFIEGALYTEASTVSSIPTSGNPTAMASIEDGTSSNRLQNRFASLIFSPRFVANGGSLLATTGGTAPINTFNKAIITYKSVNASATYSSISAGNGVIIQSTGSAFSPASVNTLLIGNGNTSAPLNGTVKKVAYYPIAVTSAQLQALTS